jgi:hypothetical protein
MFLVSAGKHPLVRRAVAQARLCMAAGPAAAVAERVRSPADVGAGIVLSFPNIPLRNDMASELGGLMMTDRQREIRRDGGE